MWEFAQASSSSSLPVAFVTQCRLDRTLSGGDKLGLGCCGGGGGGGFFESSEKGALVLPPASPPFPPGAHIQASPARVILFAVETEDRCSVIDSNLGKESADLGTEPLFSRLSGLSVTKEGGEGYVDEYLAFMFVFCPTPFPDRP